MTLKEALDDSIFDFPVKRTSYFPTHLKNLYNNYQELLSKVDDVYAEIIEQQQTQVASTCNSILKITDLIMEGKSIEAYKELDNLFVMIGDVLDPPSSRKIVFIPHYRPKFYFKARESDGVHYGRSDMFHVPFEKRYSIRTNRFSVPGLPCLYLANSAYTCWEELDRPSLSKFYISAFKEHTVLLRFLDLTPNRLEIVKWYLSLGDTTDEPNSFLSQSLSSALVLHPLLIACYTSVNDRSAKFNPEYIIPQLLMQWVLAQDHLDGIEYLSTKSLIVKNSDYTTLNNAINYALPVKNISEVGHCKTLVDAFQLTEPLSWEVLNIKKPNIKSDASPESNIYNFNRREIQLHGQEVIPYENSAFGYLEKELSHMEFVPLQN